MYEKGIYVGISYIRNVRGFIEGQAGNAARERVVCPEFLANTCWIDTQKQHMSTVIQNKGEAIACQNSLLSLNCYMEDQPLFLINRDTVSPNELKEQLKNLEKISFSLHSSRKGDDFVVKSLTSTDPIFSAKVDPQRLYFLCEMSGSVEEEPNWDEFFGRDNMLAVLIRMIKESMGGNIIIEHSIYEDEYSSSRTMKVLIKRDKEYNDQKK